MAKQIIDHYTRPSAQNDIAAMNEAAADKNFPLPSLVNSGWGRKRVLCPGCSVDLMPREYVGHYERKHGTIEEE